MSIRTKGLKKSLKNVYYALIYESELITKCY